MRLCRICLEQIPTQGETCPTVYHAAYTAPTRHGELDPVDQECICLERSTSSSGTRSYISSVPGAGILFAYLINLSYTPTIIQLEHQAKFDRKTCLCSCQEGVKTFPTPTQFYDWTFLFAGIFNWWEILGRHVSSGFLTLGRALRTRRSERCARRFRSR